MKNLNIAVVVGSLRKDSFNRKLALGLEKLAPANLSFKHVEIGNLPLYNQDADEAPAVPAVQQFRDAIKAADAVLFVTAEYNRSIPGVLKNALDQGSRPWGQSVWGGKPAGVIGCSIGAPGTSMAQQHLRNVLAFLDMPTMGQPEAFLQVRDGMFNDDGSIGAGSAEFLGKWIEAFAAHANALAK
ncbi:MAG: NAD(P)H-dependent oxidoreductase [Brachymonas sp.]|nr:NAD(P)H-dependent oxidoreductase [Brachymonas sp.]